MTINLKNKAEIVAKYGKNAKDTGSVETQIALLTEKITELTEHLKINAKDFQGKRGLLMMVGRRKRLLSYLKDRNLDDYRKLIKALNIRETKSSKYQIQKKNCRTYSSFFCVDLTLIFFESKIVRR